jgi:hypothetical protein
VRIGVLLVFLGAFAIGMGLARPRTVEVPAAGVMAPHAPKQRRASSSRPWAVEEYELTALAEYDVEARVLSVVRYRRGREADLSPLDFVVGWGPMSNDEVLAELDLGHARRFYWVSSREPPLPMRQLMEHSANMHLIPASDDVARALRGVDEDDVVHLTGKLVRVDGPGGWRWVSSLSRKDSGCELMWVESVDRR